MRFDGQSKKNPSEIGGGLKRTKDSDSGQVDYGELLRAAGEVRRGRGSALRPTNPQDFTVTLARLGRMRYPRAPISSWRSHQINREQKISTEDRYSSMKYK